MKRAICIILAAFSACTLFAAGELKLRTVVVDAGHGGKDPGCVSKDGRTYEKNLTLDIANRLCAKISESCPDVKVVKTRSKDVFVELKDRAAIANNADADLFISIHINSTKSTSPRGYSVHLLGQSEKHDLLAYNMQVCARENSVITMEDDYSTKYEGFDPSDPESFIFMQLMQNAYLEQSMDFAQRISGTLKSGPVSTDRGIWQDPFYLLWKTSMPAVLVELGFISNSSDLSILRQESSRDKLADRLLEAFIEYKRSYDSSLSIGKGSTVPADTSASKKTAPDTTAVKPSVPAARPAEPAAPEVKKDSVLYGVQIFAGATLLRSGDRQFLGYPPTIVNGGKLYKYVIGTSSSLEKVKEEFETIKATYPNSFIVRIENDSTIAVKN